MKRTIKVTAALLLILSFLLLATSCGKEIDTAALWEHAMYQSDATVGEGANTVRVTVSAGERSVTLTLQTDKATLGEALFELGLVSDPVFFDTCNGIKADWSKDKASWAFYVGDSETIADFGIGDIRATTAGEPTYRIVYIK